MYLGPFNKGSPTLLSHHSSVKQSCWFRLVQALLCALHLLLQSGFYKWCSTSAYITTFHVHAALGAIYARHNISSARMYDGYFCKLELVRNDLTSLHPLLGASILQVLPCLYFLCALSSVVNACCSHFLGPKEGKCEALDGDWSLWRIFSERKQCSAFSSKSSSVVQLVPFRKLAIPCAMCKPGSIVANCQRHGDCTVAYQQVYDRDRLRYCILSHHKYVRARCYLTQTVEYRYRALNVPVRNRWRTAKGIWAPAECFGSVSSRQKVCSFVYY